MSEMPPKMGVTHFVSEINHVENYPDFKRLVHVFQSGLQLGLWLKKSKVGQQRQMILVIFCRSESDPKIVPNVSNIFTKPTLQEAFETITQINKLPKVWN